MKVKTQIHKKKEVAITFQAMYSLTAILSSIHDEQRTWESYRLHLEMNVGGQTRKITIIRLKLMINKIYRDWQLVKPIFLTFNMSEYHWVDLKAEQVMETMYSF